MPEDKLIDPAWLVKARKDRKRFSVRVVLVFAILSVLAWWALPRLEDQVARVTSLHSKRMPERNIPGAVHLLASSAGLFKAFWGVIALGCAAAIILALAGKIDTLLPVLNIGVLLMGAAAIGLTFYVFYAPTLLVLEGLK
jgi:hypothetical protein